MGGENAQYRAWVRTQRCLMHLHDPCEGPTEAHHAGYRPGVALKAHDDTCIPLCMYHHRCIHALVGPFRNFTKTQLQKWRESSIAATRKRYKMDCLGPAEALYGFAGWLTTLAQPLTVSARHDCAMMAELISHFCKIQGFIDPEPDWSDRLKPMPTEKSNES